MPYQIAPGATSQSIYVAAKNSTTGQGQTGLAFNSAGARASYTRPGAAAQSITLATLASATAAWATGGLVKVDDVKCPGLLRLDVPDAALAAGVDYVIVSYGFDGVLDDNVHINLDTRIAALPTSVAAIKAKTDQLLFPLPNVVQSTGNSDASIRGAIGMATSNLDSQLSTILAASGGSAIGPGSIAFTVTIRDDLTNPLDGAEVWISTDAAGSNVIAGALSTDAMGKCTFMLDAGNYFLWVTHSGYNKENPTAITVS
jgi:hypothetical protein